MNTHSAITKTKNKKRFLTYAADGKRSGYVEFKNLPLGITLEIFREGKDAFSLTAFLLNDEALDIKNLLEKWSTPMSFSYSIKKENNEST
jgi:hypothetical protein